MQNHVHQEKPKTNKKLLEYTKISLEGRFFFLLKINFGKNIDVN